MGMKAGSIGGMVVMALVWGFIWMLPGGAIEAVDNVAPAAHGFTRLIDMWPQTLGLPGLVAGLLFSVLLVVTEGRRRYAEVGLGRAAAWGAVAALLVGGLVVWAIAPGLSEPASLAAVLMAYAGLMGVVAGAGSVLLFRYRAQRAGTLRAGEVRP